MTSPEWPEKLPLFTTRQLRAGGNSPEHIRTLVRRGKIVRIGRGVYVRATTVKAFAATSDGEHVLRAAAAAVQAGSGVFVSHQSAAVLHGIDLIARPGNVVTITGRPARGRNGNASLHIYSTPLPREHVTQRLGVPVTTAARTVIDLARTLTFADGVAAADSAIHKGLTSKSQLLAVLATCPGRRGVAQARRVVEFANGLSESVLESIARVVFDATGLSAPELQVWIPAATGELIGRADFYWKRYKTIAEVDGALKYDQDPSRARAQLRRDKRLREAGYEVVHFTWAEITTRPDEVAASIKAAFRFAAQKAQNPAA
jgi:predicted transcriptional regulator of viral defense system